MCVLNAKARSMASRAHRRTRAACVSLPTPCAPGFECSPVFTCIKGMEPLLATCNGTSDVCLFVKADNSSTARGRCVDERCEEVVPSTSTLALLPNSTVSMTFDIPIKTHDHCNSKDDGEPCVINGTTGMRDDKQTICMANVRMPDRCGQQAGSRLCCHRHGHSIMSFSTADSDEVENQSFRSMKVLYGDNNLLPRGRGKATEFLAHFVESQLWKTDSNA